MQRILLTLTAVAVLLAASPAVASSAASFRDGTYQGRITSVRPELNGREATMQLAHEGSGVVASVRYDGGREEWSWNDTTFTQIAYDTAGKVVEQNTAAASSVIAEGDRIRYATPRQEYTFTLAGTAATDAAKTSKVSKTRK